MKLSPYFEVNGNRYEIRRSRFLMCELEKIRESSNIADDDQKNLAKLQDKANRMQLLKQRVDELYGEYLVSFSKEAKEKYDCAQAEYDKLFDEVFEFEKSSNDMLHRLNKTVIDNAERLVITALQRDESGKEIRSKEEAESIWCSWVDEVGQKVAQEWLNALVEHISGADEIEDDNSFLSQAKARAEQRAENRKAGLAKIKK